MRGLCLHSIVITNELVCKKKIFFLQSACSFPRKFWCYVVLLLDPGLVWKSGSSPHHHRGGEEIHWGKHWRVSPIYSNGQYMQQISQDLSIKTLHFIQGHFTSLQDCYETMLKKNPLKNRWVYMLIQSEITEMINKQTLSQKLNCLSVTVTDLETLC